MICAVTDTFAQMIRRFRERIEATDDTNLITQDLLITVAQDLEKRHWMFEAQG